MPKATLSFNLPDDQEEFNHATNAIKYVIALSEIKQYLRNNAKHNENPPKDWYEVQDAINDLINSEGITDL